MDRGNVVQPDMLGESVAFLDEQHVWRSRLAAYWSGPIEKLKDLIPQFAAKPFRAAESGPSNPYLQTVVRLPQKQFEAEMPVGVVSPSYSLVQHHEIVDLCVNAVEQQRIDLKDLKFELGLTELGEWMNFRIRFPEKYNFTAKDGYPIGLRLECFNSVEGSSRLTVLLGWIRFICSNGLIIGETMVEFKAVHKPALDLGDLPAILDTALKAVAADRNRLTGWEKIAVSADTLTEWVDGKLSATWGKKAACRVLHVCVTGHDAVFLDPFAKGKASEKPVEKGVKVPGAPDQANTVFDVSQAMSWIASNRPNAEERVEWQAAIPKLIQAIAP